MFLNHSAAAPAPMGTLLHPDSARAGKRAIPAPRGTPDSRRALVQALNQSFPVRQHRGLVIGKNMILHSIVYEVLLRVTCPSTYPKGTPSTSSLSATRSTRCYMSENLALMNVQMRKHPMTNLSLAGCLVLHTNSSIATTISTVKGSFCNNLRFSR